MNEQVNQVLDFLATLVEQVVDMGEPSIAILINAGIWVLILAMVLGRFRAEQRSQSWNNLTVDERREKIMTILREAFDTAEWLYSHLNPADDGEKQLIAGKKREAAERYAKAELAAMGASGSDLVTVQHRLEWLCNLRKGDCVRYSKLRKMQS